MQRRDAFRLDFLRNWRESAAQSDTGRPFDFIICPTTTHLAWPHLGKPQEPECVDCRVSMLDLLLDAVLELMWPFPGCRLITWTTTWSVLDLPAMTLPVEQLDSEKDAAVPLPGAPFSAQDQQHWDNCAHSRDQPLFSATKLTYSAADHPEVFANAPVAVQLVNPRRFHEDELLCMAATVEAALAATQKL